MAMVLLYRDLLVTVIRNFALERRQIIGARASGKIKAIAQGAVVITVLVIALTRGEEWVSYPPPAKGRVATGVAHSLMWIVTLVTAWSAWDYFWANRRLFTRATHPQEGGEADPPA
jgi:phosphatidylglycerophosphate synthase